MKSIANKLAGLPRHAAVWTAAWATTAVHAQKVNDLPGGPAVNQLNLHPPVTKIAEEQFALHWYLLIVCTVIFVLVFAVMFYSMLKHRKSQGAKAASFHESVVVEVTWTVIPFLIIIGMALPATKLVVAQKDTTNADLTIKATGYQWKWGYDYLNGEGEGISFLSTLDPSHRAMSNAGKPEGDNYLLKVDNPLVVPVGKKVRVITTANDVVHSWMVPSFGVKQDAIPGFVRDTWFRAEQTGDFYGQCAELCGKEHAYMPIHVKVLAQNEYTAWVDSEKKRLAALADDPNKEWTLAELVERGAKVYAANCAACHQENGKGGGAIKPLDGSQVVLNQPAEQMKVLLEGRLNGAMPSWKQLSDVELAAVATYSKNHWSNKTGKLIQPADFKAARAGKFPTDGAAPAKAAAPAAAPAAAAPAAAAPATTVASAAPAAAPTTAAPAASGLPYQVFFATGEFSLDGEAQQTVKAAAEFLKSHPDAKIALSGFVDSTGTAAVNEELAKKRAQAVRDALQADGVTADRIDLRKPQAITAGQGSDSQARRVDIVSAS
ncbi:cytochrome c oxidase subunit II [Ottowia sp.]|uniref:cytochrome c oxidase subunit II n=1 Tax=Ottowia sp. TaxID=1898956 RepID=UPI002C9A9541|nr:cytochrome c oxidase subunit II [Ottowia sp.]HRN76806.1 cytochrome c oxidase subunit II [Ottowia sp.]HRQ02637.1 cytochrome c oxidase subunit II [Ottowia sp.]